MRRRILLAIVSTVALALVLAGAGTYLLLSREADRATESGLRAQAEGLDEPQRKALVTFRSTVLGRSLTVAESTSPRFATTPRTCSTRCHAIARN